MIALREGFDVIRLSCNSQDTILINLIELLTQYLALFLIKLTEICDQVLIFRYGLYHSL